MGIWILILNQVQNRTNMKPKLFVPKTQFTLFAERDRKNNPPDIFHKEYKKKHPTTSAGKRAVGMIACIRIIKLIIAEIKECLIEKQGGVFIDNFGYIFVWKSPRKRSVGTTTQSHIHAVQFQPVKNASPYLGIYEWTISRAVHPEIKQRIAMKIGGGFKYKNYIYSLKGVINSRNAAARKKVFLTMNKAAFQKSKTKASI